MQNETSGVTAKGIYNFSPYIFYRNEQLMKDCCLIPYMFHKCLGYRAVIITAKKEEYTYLDLLKGLEIDILDTPKDISEWIKECCSYISENYKKIDVMFCFGAYPAYCHMVPHYKKLRPDGKVILKLDANIYWMDRIPFQTEEYKNFLGNCDLITAESKKNEFILICAFLFRILSAKNAPVSILIIGDNYFLNIIEYIINLFNEGNRLYHIREINNYDCDSNLNNLISEAASAFYGTDFLAGNNFAAVLIDLDSIKSNKQAVLSDCSILMERDGTIICYGSDDFRSEMLNIFPGSKTSLYQLDPERFVASVCFKSKKNDTSPNSIKKKILNIIEQERAKLLENLQYILSNRPASLDDIWYSIIDDCIYTVDQIESIIANNYMLFENEDVKYQTNEVKNALLDLKYEAYLSRKHYDFFQANLLDCCNDWSSNIK
ncbi:MAG: hypothetical protein GX940_03480 [Clostridiaceae bacterium]|jgi:hypothetical protein|nr:hypothetical protein [Clostridiaceae bacterium]